MNQETHQKILKALNRVFSDLSDWLSGLGVSEREVIQAFNAAMRENGLMARLVLDSASNILSVDVQVNAGATRFETELARAQSDEYATWLLSQPEPTPEELDLILSSFKGALPKLRQHLFSSAKLGPRRRKGGRRKELADPGERENIRETIKSLRAPGVRLQDLYKRLAVKHGVSQTTIKRIWLEKKESGPL